MSVREIETVRVAIALREDIEVLYSLGRLWGAGCCGGGGGGGE